MTSSSLMDTNSISLNADYRPFHCVSCLIPGLCSHFPQPLPPALPPQPCRTQHESVWVLTSSHLALIWLSFSLEQIRRHECETKPKCLLTLENCKTAKFNDKQSSLTKQILFFTFHDWIISTGSWGFTLEVYNIGAHLYIVGLILSTVCFINRNLN